MRVMRVMAIEPNRRGARDEPIKKASSNELADRCIVTWSATAAPVRRSQDKRLRNDDVVAEAAIAIFEAGDCLIDARQREFAVFEI